jgi:hypothetical protein
MSEAELERMVAYLQENVGLHSLQSVWDQLLREGHDPALVNRAIAEYDRRSAAGPASSPAPRRPLQNESPTVWPYILLAVLVNSGLAARAAMAALSTQHHPSDTTALHFTAAIFVCEAVAALAMMVTRTLRKLGCGILSALGLAIAVGMISFVGYCMVNM